MSHRRKTLLATVGSTSFAPLTDALLSESVLAGLAATGVTSLTVQLGSARIPPHVASVIGSEGGNGVVGGLEITVIRYMSSVELETLMRNADGVVSHAGSGTILQALRVPKPLLVVPNPELMDDHQQELADALKAGGYLAVSDADHIVPGVQEMLSEDFKTFPPAHPERFQSILDETAGFV